LSRDVGGAGERLEAEWQQPSASSIGEEAEVTNAHEAARQQVEPEAAQELVDRQREQALLVGVGDSAPAIQEVYTSLTALAGWRKIPGSDRRCHLHPGKTSRG